jgi:hypothetical protein
MAGKRKLKGGFKLGSTSDEQKKSIIEELFKEGGSFFEKLIKKRGKLSASEKNVKRRRERSIFGKRK